MQKTKSSSNFLYADSKVAITLVVMTVAAAEVKSLVRKVGSVDLMWRIENVDLMWKVERVGLVMAVRRCTSFAILVPCVQIVAKRKLKWGKGFTSRMRTTYLPITAGTCQ